MWQGDPGVGKAAPLTRDEAEALRYVMFEQAGDDPALGIARSCALRRILGRVNKRLEIRAQYPAHIGVFRLPFDKALVPGMMSVVRSVQPRCHHAVKLGPSPTGVLKKP